MKKNIYIKRLSPIAATLLTAFALMGVDVSLSKTELGNGLSVFSVAHAQLPPPSQRSGETRGEYLHNPMAMEKGQNFYGEVSSVDARFAQFDSAAEGIRAGARNVLNYQRNHGLDTVAEIVNRYAPGSENKATRDGVYQENIAKALGVGIHDKINLEDPNVLAIVTKTIIKQENGRVVYSDEEILAAVKEAYVSKPKSTAENSKPDRGTLNAVITQVAMPNYTADQLKAAKCDTRVWNEMLGQYAGMVERHMAMATQVQVTNQVAATPKLPSNCYDELVSIANTLTAALNTITGFMAGSGFDPDAASKYIIAKFKDQAVQMACSTIDSVLKESGLGSVLNEGMGIMNGALDELKGVGSQYGVGVGEILDAGGYKPGNASTNPYYQSGINSGDIQSIVNDNISGVNTNLIPGGGIGGGTNGGESFTDKISGAATGVYDQITNIFK